MRAVTDEEIAFYETHGWVKLDGLISRELAQTLLEGATALKANADGLRDTPANASETKTATAADGSKTVDIRTPDWRGIWRDRPGSDPAVRDYSSSYFQARNIRVDPFHSFNFSDEIGQTAHRIMNRIRLTDEPIGVRYCEDTIIYKPPHEEDVDSFGMGYHQDQHTFGADRVGGFNLWIAIDEVRPEQGGMRFLTGSHRAGDLGTSGLLESYPKLLDAYELSPPFHYQPGDATVHHSYTIHGTPANLSDWPRWSYILALLPSDCIMATDRGVGMPPPNEQFPLVYSPT